jgi:hypothetical protein
MTKTKQSSLLSLHIFTTKARFVCCFLSDEETQYPSDSLHLLNWNGFQRLYCASIHHSLTLCSTSSTFHYRRSSEQEVSAF